MKNLKFIVFGFALFLGGSFHVGAFSSASFLFEENRGQAPESVRFLARGQGYTAAFTAEGNTLILTHAGRRAAVRTRLRDASPDRIRGEEKQAGVVNYIRSAESLLDIPTYGSVRYQDVYPGIDLVYYGKQHELEYDFIVAPGADPDRIVLDFEGVDAASIDADGNLRLTAGGGEIIQRKPVVYQRIDGERREIAGAYRMLSSTSVAFQLGAYDHTAAVVIDPILNYATYLGGVSGNDDARSIGTDGAGNIYIVGSTSSLDFPTASAIQAIPGGLASPTLTSDVFITKLNSTGSTILFSTYLGGNGDDAANAIAVNSSGAFVIAGVTQSSDFPTSSAGVLRTCGGGPSGCQDAFVVGFNSNGVLSYSTYWGGTGVDVASAIATDAFGSAYVVGSTTSTDLQTTVGAYSVNPDDKGFVLKLGPGGEVFYSTYFGTIFGPATPRGVAVDNGGNAYITGSMAVSGSGNVDVFLTKLNPVGTGILYIQTLRAANEEVANAITLDAAGNVYVTGQTASANFPVSSDAVQRTFSGGSILRTFDSGQRWSPSADGITRRVITALAAASDAASTMYAGADDETVGALYKSIDGGQTWTASGSGLTDLRIKAITVDPSTPATVYAVTRTQGVFKSTNSGGTWSPTGPISGPVTSVAVDPSSSSTVYAGTSGSGVWKSVTGGASWFPINDGLTALDVRSLIVVPGAQGGIFAGTSDGVYRSTTSVSFTFAGSGITGGNVAVVAADPRNPGVLLAGTNGNGIFRTSNSGASWSFASDGLTGNVVSAITVDAAGAFYAAAGDASSVTVHRSTTGSTWTATSLAASRINALAADRQRAGTVLAGSSGSFDAFVAKWKTSGSLVYSTYVGGAGDDFGNGIAVDSTGGIYIGGTTRSRDFPVSNALQFTSRGGAETFAAKIDPLTFAFEFSTFLGGTGDDFANGVVLDAANSLYLVGSTTSPSVATAGALFPNRLGLQDAFVVKLGDGSSLAYAVPGRGGFTVTSAGAPPSAVVGYGRIQQTSGFGMPSGLAIFGFRQNNILVSEAAVPASTPISSGRIYAEVTNEVNTGIALANPNNLAAQIEYSLVDRLGRVVGTGSFTIPANRQIAGFLNQAPFNAGGSFFGTLSFTSSQPVAVIALRGLTNERGEFLITTLPVADLAAPSTNETILFPHFADGGGWVTQILLVNTTSSEMSGTVEFAGLGTQPYTIAAQSAARIATPGTASDVRTGSARVATSVGSIPTGVAVFSFKNLGVTVTEAGVPATRAGTAFRVYAESSGVDGTPGFIQTGFALANPSDNNIQVTFEVTTLSGFSTGFIGSTVIPGRGQTALFLNQIPGLQGLQNPFQGVVRVSTNSPAGVSIVGLRGRYNERRDFLITTTPPVNEANPSFVSEQFFPHFVDGV